MEIKDNREIMIQSLQNAISTFENIINSHRNQELITRDELIEPDNEISEYYRIFCQAFNETYRIGEEDYEIAKNNTYDKFTSVFEIFSNGVNNGQSDWFLHFLKPPQNCNRNFNVYKLKSTLEEIREYLMPKNL